MQKHKGILAIDFDNTIAKVPNFPVIEGLMPFAKTAIKKLFNQGWFIIINTCRSGERELEAIDFLVKSDIPFDLINQNHPGLIEVFGIDCRKISADIYIDDKNCDQVSCTKGFDWVETFMRVHRYKKSSMLDLCKEIEA